MILQFVLVTYGDFEFFSGNRFAEMNYNFDKSNCNKDFEYRLEIISFIRHLTFTFVILVIDSIVFLKLLEWHNALKKIQKENKMDEVVVKIQLMDNISTYDPEYVIKSRRTLCVLSIIVIHGFLMFWVIPYTTSTGKYKDSPEVFFYVYMTYDCSIQLIFILTFIFIFYRLVKMMKRHRLLQYVHISKDLKYEFLILLSILIARLIVSLMKLANKHIGILLENV